MKDEDLVIEFPEDDTELSAEEIRERMITEYLSVLTPQEERIARFFLAFEKDPDQDYRQAAEELGIPEAAIRLRVRRIKRKVQRRQSPRKMTQKMRAFLEE